MKEILEALRHFIDISRTPKDFASASDKVWSFFAGECDTMLPNPEVCGSRDNLLFAGQNLILSCNVSYLQSKNQFAE